MNKTKIVFILLLIIIIIISVLTAKGSKVESIENTEIIENLNTKIVLYFSDFENYCGIFLILV